jgi:hypothetical protein
LEWNNEDVIDGQEEQRFVDEVESFVWATGGGKTVRIRDTPGRVTRHSAWDNIKDKKARASKCISFGSKTLGFGRIEFVGQEGHLLPYVRIPWSESTTPGSAELSPIAMAALCYVENVWELPRPKLLISVTGGAQDFPMNRSKQDVLYKLMEAARQTNAWIITGGTDAGIMKHVGTFLNLHSSDLPSACFRFHSIGKYNPLTHRKD